VGEAGKATATAEGEWGKVTGLGELGKAMKP